LSVPPLPPASLPEPPLLAGPPPEAPPEVPPLPLPPRPPVRPMSTLAAGSLEAHATVIKKPNQTWNQRWGPLMSRLKWRSVQTESHLPCRL
jgi:hypothetical protein